jgi:hypothetical protein
MGEDGVQDRVQDAVQDRGPIEDRDRDRDREPDAAPAMAGLVPAPREARRDNGMGMSRENKVMLRVFVGVLILGALGLFTFWQIANGGAPKTTGYAGPPSQHVESAGGWAYLSLLLPLAAVIALPVAIGLAVYGIFFAGRDRDTFRRREVEEQERLLEAGDVLQHSIGNGPTVANTITTRQGRKAGRAATRASRRTRRQNKHR